MYIIIKETDDVQNHVIWISMQCTVMIMEGQ